MSAFNPEFLSDDSFSLLVASYYKHFISSPDETWNNIF